MSFFHKPANLGRVSDIFYPSANWVLTLQEVRYFKRLKVWNFSFFPESILEQMDMAFHLEHNQKMTVWTITNAEKNKGYFDRSTESAVQFDHIWKCCDSVKFRDTGVKYIWQHVAESGKFFCSIQVKIVVHWNGLWPTLYLWPTKTSSEK